MKKLLLALLCLFSFSVFSNDDLDMDRMMDEAIELAGEKLSPKEKEMMREKLKPQRAKIRALMKMSQEEQLKFIAEGEHYLNSPKGKEELNNELNQLSPEEREMLKKLR